MATSKILEQFGNMHVILDEDEQSHQGALYLGDYTAASDLKLLRQRNVRTVLTCAGNLDIFFCNQIVHHIYEDMVDNENCDLLRYFPETNLAIQEGLHRGSVLVHCAAGVTFLFCS